MVAVIVTGDDVARPVQLTKDGASFVIDPGATVRAAIVDEAHKKVLMAAVTLDEGATGAVWATSLLVVEMTAAETAAITETGNAVLEIEVDDGGKETFFENIQVIPGLIA